MATALPTRLPPRVTGLYEQPLTLSTQNCRQTPPIAALLLQNTTVIREPRVNPLSAVTIRRPPNLLLEGEWKPKHVASSAELKNAPPRTSVALPPTTVVVCDNVRGTMGTDDVFALLNIDLRTNICGALPPAVAARVRRKCPTLPLADDSVDLTTERHTTTDFKRARVWQLRWRPKSLMDLASIKLVRDALNGSSRPAPLQPNIRPNASSPLQLGSNLQHPTLVEKNALDRDACPFGLEFPVPIQVPINVPRWEKPLPPPLALKVNRRTLAALNTFTVYRRTRDLT